MEYTPEFEHQISDLEACALRLATTEEDTEEYEDAQRQFAAILDDLVNTYPVECDRLEQHANTVRRIWQRENERVALKRISTTHVAFIDNLCDDFDPTF